MAAAMSDASEPILVTGAGVAGGEVLRQLAAAHRAACALVRDCTRAEPFRRLGIKLIEGDFSDKESWKRALDGVAAVFNITVAHPDAVSWNAMFLDHARRYKVKHIVQLSGMSVSTSSPAEFHQQMSKCDEALKASGVSYTILQPNVFHQNMLRMAAPIRNQGRFRSVVGEALISMIDVRDVGEVAVKALTEDGHAGKVYVLTGPESVTYFDVARILSKVLGKTVLYEVLTVEEGVRELIKNGVPESVARSRVGVHRSFSTGTFADVTGDVQKLLNRAPRSFSEFARDYASTFR
jgi:uncharacterized protein YbjT (DUF2867 family)